jgi:AAA15 family ATPase/GTPase
VRISRIKIRNFASFSDLDVETGDSIVIVGENRVGKSNLIRALQLILDPGLAEASQPAIPHQGSRSTGSGSRLNRLSRLLFALMFDRLRRG